MYKQTGDASYYDTAVRVANYFLDNIPADGIVPWCVIFSCKWPSYQWVRSTRDYNAPLIPAPRPADSSAATIAANGLLLLSQLEPSPSLKQKWSDAAIGVCFFSPEQATIWQIPSTAFEQRDAIGLASILAEFTIQWNGQRTGQ